MIRLLHPPDELPSLHSLQILLHNSACTLLTTCETSVLEPLSPPQACKPVTRQTLDHLRDSGSAAAPRDRHSGHWSASSGLVVCPLVSLVSMGKNKGGGSAKGQAGGETKGPKPATHVNVRHILCQKHSKIMEALGRIQAGEQFSQVAAQMSEDKARQGGALGWKTRQDVVGAFADAAFQLGVGDITQAPVKTQFGYHLILCEGRK